MEFRIVGRLFDKLVQATSVKNIYSCILTSRSYSSFESDFDDFEDGPQRPRSNQRFSQADHNQGYRRSDQYQRHGQRDQFQRQGQRDPPQRYGQQDYYQRYGQRDTPRGFGERDFRQGFGQRNSYQGHAQRDSFGKPRMNRNSMAIDVPKVKWTDMELQPINKNLYTQSDDRTNISAEKIAEFRRNNDIVIQGDHQNINPILQFSDYQFPHNLQKALDSMHFEAPLAIQSVSWPLLLSGLDLIGIGQTGSGKTLGFTLPAIIHALSQPKDTGPRVVVLAPTRELAQQINTVFLSMCKYSDVRTACIFGGASKMSQYHELQKNPLVIIATPGRLMDLMSTRAINLMSTTCFILDEADRMLDMGFEPQIRTVASNIRPDRQTLMWSATWPNEVRKLANQFTNNPIHVSIGSSDLTVNPNIQQDIEFCSPEEKFDRLTEVLKEESHNRHKVLIFVSTQKAADYVARRLERTIKSICESLHGGLTQTMRDSVTRGFRSGKINIVVATDVASRGLDVSDIGLVVNYEMPTDLDSYIHRIGRTARAGKKGRSLSFLGHADNDIAKQLLRLLRKNGQKVPAELEQFSGPRRLY